MEKARFNVIEVAPAGEAVASNLKKVKVSRVVSVTPFARYCDAAAYYDDLPQARRANSYIQFPTASATFAARSVPVYDDRVSAEERVGV